MSGHFLREINPGALPPDFAEMEAPEPLLGERLSQYLHSLDRDGDPDLERLRERAEDAGVPVIRREMESFLRVLLTLKKPERILEIGTAIGYSALFFASETPEETTVTTIENFRPRIEAARENFQSSPYAGRILLIEGDAAAVLKGLTEIFDFIFLDAAKGQYIRFLPDLLSLLREGGVLVSDNVLQGGTILESRYALKRRERTIHRRMRDYLFALTHTEGLVTSIVPVGDGAAVTVKGGGRVRDE